MLMHTLQRRWTPAAQLTRTAWCRRWDPTCQVTQCPKGPSTVETIPAKKQTIDSREQHISDMRTEGGRLGGPHGFAGVADEGDVGVHRPADDVDQLLGAFQRSRQVVPGAPGLEAAASAEVDRRRVRLLNRRMWAMPQPTRDQPPGASYFSKGQLTTPLPWRCWSLEGLPACLQHDFPPYCCWLVQDHEARKDLRAAPDQHSQGTRPPGPQTLCAAHLMRIVVEGHPAAQALGQVGQGDAL